MSVTGTGGETVPTQETLRVRNLPSHPYLTTLQGVVPLLNGDRTGTSSSLWRLPGRTSNSSPVWTSTTVDLG